MPTPHDRRQVRALSPVAVWHPRPGQFDRRTGTAPPTAPPSPPPRPFPPRPENGSGSNPATLLQPSDHRQSAGQTARPLSAAKPGPDAEPCPQTAVSLAKAQGARARIPGQWGLAPAWHGTDLRLTSRFRSLLRTAKPDGAAFVECPARKGTSRLPQSPSKRHRPGTDCFSTVLSETSAHL